MGGWYRPSYPLENFLSEALVTEGLCNKHLHFQNILSKCHYFEFIILATQGISDFELCFLLWQKISNEKIEYKLLYKKNFVNTRGSFFLKF